MFYNTVIELYLMIINNLKSYKYKYKNPIPEMEIFDSGIGE